MRSRVYECLIHECASHKRGGSGSGDSAGYRRRYRGGDGREPATQAIQQAVPDMLMIILRHSSLRVSIKSMAMPAALLLLLSVVPMSAGTHLSCATTPAAVMLDIFAIFSVSSKTS